MANFSRFFDAFITDYTVLGKNCQATFITHLQKWATSVAVYVKLLRS